jgi:uncharacterized membrane protein
MLNVLRDPHRAPLQLALAGVFGALVFVVSFVLQVPIPATGGYFNFGETIIYVAALTFGPLTGALAGGVGAMISDALLAPQFAFGTLVIKLVEGAIVGFLGQNLRRRTSRFALASSVAIIVGGLEMVAGYFIYEQAILGVTFFVALSEVPANLAQMGISLAIALPLVLAVMRVFPQLKSSPITQS